MDSCFSGKTGRAELAPFLCICAIEIPLPVLGKVLGFGALFATRSLAVQTIPQTAGHLRIPNDSPPDLDPLEEDLSKAT